jgi:hypothetical protein
MFSVGAGRKYASSTAPYMSGTVFIYSAGNTPRRLSRYTVTPLDGIVSHRDLLFSHFYLHIASGAPTPKDLFWQWETEIIAHTASDGWL